MDEDINLGFDYDIVDNLKDPNHVKRKQQQRAISNQALKVALFYGLKKRTFKDFSSTLYDKSLRGTIYEKYTDKLRGLTVVYRKEVNKYYLITAYWDYKIKASRRF